MKSNIGLDCLVLVLTAIAAGACAPPADVDHAGNLYPPQCAGDLEDEPVTVLRMKPAAMEDLAVKMHLKSGLVLHGLWFPGVILVEDDLWGWVAADNERHERCHQRMYRLTGNAHWHRSIP